MGRITARTRVTRITVGRPHVPSRGPPRGRGAARDPRRRHAARRHDAHARPRRRARRRVPRLRGRSCAPRAGRGRRPLRRRPTRREHLQRARRHARARRPRTGSSTSSAASTRRARAGCAARRASTPSRTASHYAGRRRRCASTRRCSSTFPDRLRADRRCSTRPAGCTPPRCSTAAPASCSCCARTSAATTPSTRWSAGRCPRGGCPAARHGAAGVGPRELRARRRRRRWPASRSSPPCRRRRRSPSSLAQEAGHDARRLPPRGRRWSCTRRRGARRRAAGVPWSGADVTEPTASPTPTSRCSPQAWAVGVPGDPAARWSRRSTGMGPARTARLALAINQKDGFDCMSCAWPDPGHRNVLEFCENGAKAVDLGGHAGHRRRRSFWAEHSLTVLLDRTEYWLGQQGRLTEPVYKPAGIRPLRADHLGRRVPAHRRARCNALDSPDQRRVLHERPHLERDGVRLPAVRARVRHQQPARLLEHVPRVDRHRDARDDRHRQVDRRVRRLREGRPRHRDGPEPRHQPSAHADRARGDEAQRRPRSSR